MTARRLLFVAPSSYILSGLATWLDYLQPGLRSRGWDAWLGLVSGPVHNRPEAYLPVHPSDHWLPIHTETCTPEGRRRALDRAIHAVCPDLIVSVNIPDCYAAVAHQRRRRGHAPRVAMALHGIQADLVHDARFYGGVLDGVITSNRLAAALVAASAGIPAVRVLYAPCGVAAARTGDNVGQPGQGEPLRVVYSGRLEQGQKRVRDLPAIAAGLSAAGIDWRLRIAGTGPEEPWLRTQFAAPDSVGRVEFLGHVPSERMGPEVYAWADALLVTSSWETGPLVIWEAMAHGVAVVSSAYVGSGLEAALLDGRNCLIFPVGDAGAAAAALARLVRDAALREMLREHGRHLVLERYSTEASVAAWERALLGVLALPELPAPAVLPEASPSGRLDRCLGAGLAETLRVLARRRWHDADAGGEWPHAHACPSRQEEDAFWQRAALLDGRQACLPGGAVSARDPADVGVATGDPLTEGAP